MNYKKDKSYIKQRLEYVSPVDYISELEEKIENLQEENEEVKDQKKKAIEYIKKSINYYYDEDLEESIYQDEVSGNELLKILGGDE